MQTTLPPIQSNNPSKEILASSGIYDKKVYGNPIYAANFPNSPDQNKAVASTTPDPNIPLVYAPNLTHAFVDVILSSSFKDAIDDMYIINPYVPY